MEDDVVGALVDLINGLKIHTEEYLKVFKDVVKPWMDGVAAGHR